MKKLLLPASTLFLYTLYYYCCMTIYPPFLQPGDTIGIVCPAGYMPLDDMQTCLSVLQQWGYRIKMGHTAGSQHNYFSGTDRQRLDDLQQMMDDDEVQAILCARGGYGLGRIIDQLNFSKFIKKPKWIIGYSDITVLHSHLYRNYKIASLHSPMAAAFNNGGYANEYVQSLRLALNGQEATYTCKADPYNHLGTTTGRLVGGNLSLLAHLTGTPSDIQTNGRILFLEDIGEYIYNVDRMLYQLKRSGKLAKLAGLIIGQFTDMKDTTIPFGQNVYEVIRDVVREYDYPICFHFPVGHTYQNYTLKVGGKYSLSVAADLVSLSEIN